MILIQHIETHWTKQSRGMPGAAARNAVPRVLRLPSEVRLPAGLYIHRVRAREESEFQLQETTEEYEDARTYWTLFFQSEANAVQVLSKYSAMFHGKPPRRPGRRPLFRLAPGEWGAYHINGRFAGYFGQYYLSHFVNIALISDGAPAGIFTTGAPDHQADQMADLF